MCIDILPVRIGECVRLVLMIVNISTESNA